MSISFGSNSLSIKEIEEIISEETIINYYLGIDVVPCVINSPLREDKKPSFGLYSPDGIKIRYKDFATGEKGDIYDLLSQIWNLPLDSVLTKIINDLNNLKKSKIQTIFNKDTNALSAKGLIIKNKEHPKIEVKIREWKDYDIKYWESYGISLDWLKFADVYPISHKFITKGDKSFVFGADKYAYAYVEKKEGNISIKVYQPFNKNGFKWCTSTDSSVISLWTKVPEFGDKICICSSLKDALCLWSNTGIPAIATQGEAYNISQTAINELNRRYKNIYILLDNDESGLVDGVKLSSLTGFKNLILPQFDGGKDVSDLYHILQDKKQFKKTILQLFNN